MIYTAIIVFQYKTAYMPVYLNINRDRPINMVYIYLTTLEFIIFFKMF